MSDRLPNTRVSGSATETTEESPYECDHCADGEAFIGSKSCAYCGRDTEEE